MAHYHEGRAVANKYRSSGVIKNCMLYFFFILKCILYVAYAAR